MATYSIRGFVAVRAVEMAGTVFVVKVRAIFRVKSARFRGRSTADAERNDFNGPHSRPRGDRQDFAGADGHGGLRNEPARASAHEPN
jgi:hypothetical protein